MNKFTKFSIFVVVLGAALFAVQTSTNDSISPLGADDTVFDSADRVSAAVPGRSTEAQQHRVDAAVDVDRAFAAEQLNNDYYVAESGVADVAERASDRSEKEDRERKQQAAQAKMSARVAALALAGGPEPADIVVSYKDHPELFEDGRVEELGGEVLRHYEVLDLLAIRLPAESLIDFAIDEDVERVSLDDVIAISSMSARAAANVPSHVSSNVGFKGNGQTVAILDTGVASHADLTTTVRQYSFLNGAMPAPILDGKEIDSYRADPNVDGYGHGTHIAGTIAGTGLSSGNKYKGPATGVSVLSLQVLDADGHGSMSDVMAALDWLLVYGNHFNVGVANLSLGKPITESYTTDPLVAAVEAVWDSGIVVVVSAGNYGREGYYSITSPGNSRKVITVGSLTDNGTGDDFTDDYASTYSSRGPTVLDHVVKPDLLAPGNRLVAAAPQNSNLAALLPNNVVECSVSLTCTDDYIALSGTSMATGVVSAAAAMMLDKDPTLSPATVKARLMRSTRKINGEPVVVGAGLLDIDAAMNETGTLSGEALSPLMSYDAATGGTLVQDTSSLWGSDIWGAGYLWTDGVAANGFLWTDGGVNANGYLWTDGSLWANGYLWTDGGVAAFGYLWTDGIEANGYLWTDGGIGAKGYLWTDGFKAQSLYDLYDADPNLNDDDHGS